MVYIYHMLDKNVYFLGYLFFPQRSKLNFITYVTKLHSSECNVIARYEILKKLSMTLITKGSAIKDPTKLTKTKCTYPTERATQHNVKTSPIQAQGPLSTQAVTKQNTTFYPT